MSDNIRSLSRNHSYEQINQLCYYLSCDTITVYSACLHFYNFLLKICYISLFAKGDNYKADYVREDGSKKKT